MKNIFDVIMTEENGAYVAKTLGLEFSRWSRSVVSESTYLYMRHPDGFEVKIRFSLHGDNHFDEWETLGTFRITEFAYFDPEEFADELSESEINDLSALSDRESTREDYWRDRPGAWDYHFSQEWIVKKLTRRLDEIKAKWNEQEGI